MISMQKAIKLTHAQYFPLGQEQVAIAGASQRILAENIVAKEDLPLFSNSAMDGFAVRAHDLRNATENHEVSLKISGVQPAGKNQNLELLSGQAIRIMTGAILPKGADSIVNNERVCVIENRAFFQSQPQIGQHVRQQGEEIRKRDVIYSAGKQLNPRDLGFLANLGCAVVTVSRQPQIAVITTGDELVEPGQEKVSGQIFDANTPLIRASLAKESFASEAMRLPDDQTSLEKAFASILEKFSVLIVAGGVSVGDYDFTRAAFDNLGVQEIFWQVAQKPGKPLYFGRKNNTLIFGLPGNPVSAWFCFFYYVLPHLKFLQGARSWRPKNHTCVLTSGLQSDVQRTVFYRGILQEKSGHYHVTGLSGQGSHMLQALANANALIAIPPGMGMVSPGTQVLVYPID